MDTEELKEALERVERLEKKTLRHQIAVISEDGDDGGSNFSHLRRYNTIEEVVEYLLDNNHGGQERITVLVTVDEDWDGEPAEPVFHYPPADRTST